MLIGIIALVVIVLVVQVLLWVQLSALKTAQGQTDQGALRSTCEALEKGMVRLEAQFREDMKANRTEGADQASRVREEIQTQFKSLSDMLRQAQTEAAQGQEKRLAEFAERLEKVRGAVETQLGALNENSTRQWESRQKADTANALAARQELADALKRQSEALTAAFKKLEESSRTVHQEASGAQAERLKEFAGQLEKVATGTEGRLEKVRLTLEEQLKALNAAQSTEWEKKREADLAQAKQTRAELNAALEQLANSVTKNVNAMTEIQRSNFETITGRVEKLTEGTGKQLEQMRETVDARLKTMQEANAQKLEEMRNTVDEKLQGTLEKRLGESFTLVSERLEQVHKGLGEMQTLANGVGDLKRVLTNVKTRGTWGEIQLGSLLEQILSPQQFARNICPVPGKNEVVEFAIRLPGRDEGQKELWLPIDAKYPNEDYERLLAAQEAGDVAAIETAGRQLENQLKKCARDICEKYVAPPHTTDFAILFLPTEGLYAEIIRRTDLVQAMQRDFRVTVAGPTTLTAILNSLQMGFRTLAIQKRSSEVWTVLGQTKTEFGKYGDVLDKVRKKLSEAQNTVDQAAVRTRAIERSLKGVEALPSADAGEESVATLKLELMPLEDETGS